MVNNGWEYLITPKDILWRLAVSQGEASLVSYMTVEGRGEIERRLFCGTQCTHKSIEKN